MKTMKYILLILCVSVATSVQAVDFKIYETSHLRTTSTTQLYGGNGVGYPKVATAPVYVPMVEFRSTSAMPASGSSLSIAAQDVIIDEGGNASIPSGPKRLPALPPDPFLDPLGDAVLPLLLLAAGYAICAWRKNKSHSRLATPESK